MGGIGSVRGFQSGTLGGYSKNGNDYTYYGATREIMGSVEILTPLPGGDRSLRVFGFLDVGNGWGYDYKDGNWTKQKVKLKELRASTGIGLAWLSPLGPLKFSYAFPIRKDINGKTDETERFQFQIGTSF